MTEETNAIMLKPKGLSDPKRRDQALAEFNRSTLDDVGPVGGQDQQMRVLGEMNELAKEREQLIQESVPTTNLL